MKTYICPKCGAIAEKNAYYGRITCTSCGWEDYDKTNYYEENKVVYEAVTLLDNISNDERIRLLRDYGFDVNYFNRVRSWLKDQLPRPQGYWEVAETTEDNGTRYKCSVCGGEVLCFNPPKYCENCGTKMWE